MGGFFSKLFGKAEQASDYSDVAPLTADMHSHVLPGLDDGAPAPEQSLELLRHLYDRGYRKLIMTPHIMGDFYKNTPEGIREKLAIVKESAASAGIDMELECAAEYYLDEWFVTKLNNGTEMLTFGKEKYLLFETSYINKAIQYQEAVFTMKAAGYTPVLAHPERYTYMYGKFDEIVKMRQDGVLLQLNINSLSGYYSQTAQKIAERMIDEKLVDFAGTDAHNPKHLQALDRTRALKYYKKLLQLPLLNHSL